MRISRRRLLSWITAGFATTGGIALFLRSRRSPKLPVLPNGEPGTLSSAAWDAIRAVPEALVDGEVERTHYETFYRFRAENVDGYGALYERFGRDADREARELFGKRFSEASLAERRRVLDAFDLPRDRRALVDVLFDPWPARFHHFIIGETLELYNDTDAWVRLGYGAWPGMPRTLAFMQVPPSELARHRR